LPAGEKGGDGGIKGVGGGGHGPSHGRVVCGRRVAWWGFWGKGFCGGVTRGVGRGACVFERWSPRLARRGFWVVVGCNGWDG
jgi:hypothetical protein